MFAFAAWDTREQQLLLARDRLGIKPLYYRLLPDGIAFASELKALLVLGQPEVDRSALRDFLFHGYIPAPKTIYRGIAKLPAGHTLTWAKGRISIERYWNPRADTIVRGDGDTVQELDALLREVVPEHTLSDVPVGVFLSGGIDSALTTYYLDAPHTYTLGFDAGARSESDAARRVAEHLRTEHMEMTAPQADFAGALEHMPGLFDEPFGDSAAWSNYLIAQFARREVKVALSGEGGDEIFCGYPRYWSRIGARSTLLNRALARYLPPLSRLSSSMQRRAYTGLPAYAAALGGLTARQIDSLLAPHWREPEYDYLWFYRQYWREDLHPLARLRWLDLNTDLAEGLLTKVDRTSMAHSLEVRPPLLDHRLVEFMLRVDPGALVDRRQRRGKLLVRQLMEPRLPAGHLNRPKSGFGLPVHRWLRRHPEVLRGAVGRLMDRGVLQRPVGPEFRRAWYLLVLDRWFAAFA
jgi:asparagine synthase (glutamine-hydrolysing)